MWWQTLILSNADLSDVQNFILLIIIIWSRKYAEMQVNFWNQTLAVKITKLRLLRKRFHNKRLIIMSPLESIVDSPACKAESHIGLRKILNMVLLNLHALEALNHPVNPWNDLLIVMIASKLD